MALSKFFNKIKMFTKAIKAKVLSFIARLLSGVKTPTDIIGASFDVGWLLSQTVMFWATQEKSFLWCFRFKCNHSHLQSAINGGKCSLPIFPPQAFVQPGERFKFTPGTANVAKIPFRTIEWQSLKQDMGLVDRQATDDYLDQLMRYSAKFESLHSELKPDESLIQAEPLPDEPHHHDDG